MLKEVYNAVLLRGKRPKNKLKHKHGPVRF